MGCECNKTAKIVFIVAIILTLVGGIIVIGAIATASASFDVGFEIEKKSSGSVTVQSGHSNVWKFEVYISQSDWESKSKCNTIHAGVTITGCTSTDNAPIIFMNQCSDTSSTVDGTWQKGNDPPLRRLGSFPGRLQSLDPGTCTITSGKELWVVDAAEEVGEAVGGIMAAIGLVMVGVVVALIGSILCCVGCCCLGNSSGGGNAGNQPTTVVVGQATE